jgi:hypothetical protein
MSKKSEAIIGLEAKGFKIPDDQVDVQNLAESDLARVAGEEKFMHDVLKIMIFPTTDPNAPPYAQVNVNGQMQPIPRSVPVPVYRKHVEVLARMKETRITQDMTPNPQGEITTDSLRGHTGLAYPFSVVHDPSPKGGAWLANILAERG